MLVISAIFKGSPTPMGRALKRLFLAGHRISNLILVQLPSKYNLLTTLSAHGYTNGRRICVETEKRRFRLALMDKTVLRHFMGVSRYSGRYKATDNILSVLMNCLQGGRSKDYGVPIVYMIDIVN